MSVLVIRGDARRLPLPDNSVDLIVTSPPYFGLRSYTDGGVHYEGQLGSEATPAEYVAALVGCTREWVRVLKPCGSLFVNLGDKYAGTDGTTGGTSRSTLAGASNGRPRGMSEGTFHGGGRKVPGQPKSLLGLPWRYALNCTDQLGLILRAEIIWAKPNGLPESVTDRVRRAHEQVFHFTLRPRYYAAVDEIREPHIRLWDAAANGPGSRYDRNQRRGVPNGPHALGALPGSVWNIPSQPLTIPPHLGTDHFAAFPMELPRRIIAGWSPPGVCVACSQGRRPVVDKALVGVWHDKPPQNSHHAGTRTEHQHHLYGVKNTFGSTSATITGYACACPQPTAPTRPAIILDPFGGTGTTALLAHALGRTGITIDRSADYSRLAAWRTSDPGELARALEVPKPPPVPEGMDALF